MSDVMPEASIQRPLKCIGGKAHANIILVPRDWRGPVRVQLPIEWPSLWADGLPKAIDTVPVQASVYYVIDRVHVDGDVIEYLRPEASSALSVFRMLLT